MLLMSTQVPFIPERYKRAKNQPLFLNFIFQVIDDLHFFH
jgi:hypothetical protein